MEQVKNESSLLNLPKFETNGCTGDQLDTKYFNDPIHGHIQLHPLLVKVIDTPQFQRLRNIKQLGANYMVYPGASHNRFEHCIGTCYLAGTLARHLQNFHSDLLDERDILCVELAGLCHDLGHGPYSHMFDLKLLPKLNPASSWKHEDGSCSMLDHLIEDNKLESEFTKYKLSLTKDVIFIKEMINGPMGDKNAEWKYIGRERQKSFLYEIVSNERNKVDVDKWDYFARDCHHLGIKNSFDHKRFMQFLKVLTVEGECPQICARDKECLNLYEMFHTRGVLHRRAYGHKVSTAIETMICDAMLLANDYIKIEGKDGRMLKISETVTDMVAFTKLTDNIFYQILYSTDDCDKMKEARRILNRILCRDLYKYVGQCRPPKNCSISQSHKDCERIQKELAALVPNLESDDIVINVSKYNYGMKDRNPCDQFRFYSKQNPNTPYQIRREEISHMLPETFEDCEILAYSKTADKIDLVKQSFSLWCSSKRFPPPSTLEPSQSSLTPMKSDRKRIGVPDVRSQTGTSKSLKFST